ncbi:hypothetical protein MKX01_038662 [Papaver californicum]|nr:hypothetical protein MKX01_038662 [Papaver californicum]
MESEKPRNKSSSSLYPQVIESNPDSYSPFSSNPKTSSSSSLYPSVHSYDPVNTTTTTTNNNSNTYSASSGSFYPSLDMKDLVDNLFPDEPEKVHSQNHNTSAVPTAPIESVEEVLIKIPGALVHLIDKQQSVELACGDLTIVRLRQNENVVAVLVRVGDQIQWPLAKDEAAVKLDDSHYFFSLRIPSTTVKIAGSDSDEEAPHQYVDNEFLNYGITIASKGQGNLMKELDGILEHYSSFSVQKVSEKSDVLDGSMAKEISPAEMKSEGKKKELMEDRSAAYWTTIAPNVEDYSGCVAKLIASGSGQMIRGILWCGDVTVNRLKWGNDFLTKRLDPCTKQSEVSPQTMRRIKRVKRITKMSEKVATGVLSGVVKVSGFFTSPIVNSKAGKKFFSLLPGEIVLASLDGFSKVFDAVEVAGKNVMSTTSTVTTGLVSHKYGDKAAEATNEGMDAAGHAFGTAWAVLKIRNALNPKSAFKPTSLAKSAAKAAAADLKASKSKKK